MEQDYAARPLSPAFRKAALVVAFAWLVWLADHLLGLGLGRYGVLPREPSGLVGVVTAPFLHGSFAHLFANTLPALILGGSLLWAYPRAAPWVLVLVLLGSGLGTWIFGRPAFHLGASGMTHGLMVFLFVGGILRRDRPSVAVAMITFFLYGGMLAGILPGDPDISFEMHLFGALSGLAAAFLLARRDPPPPRKQYSWEEEDEEGENGPPRTV
jgi:membrane associated rhomboid family serine protease